MAVGEPAGRIIKISGPCIIYDFTISLLIVQQNESQKLNGSLLVSTIRGLVLISVLTLPLISSMSLRVAYRINELS